VATPSEPDNGVEGNPDLGRLFELLIRSQAAQQRTLNDMRDSAQRQLHMAQTFMTSPGAAQQAQQARQGMSGARAGQTIIGQTVPGTGGTTGRVWNVTSAGVASSGQPQGLIGQPPGPPAGTPTTSGAPSQPPPSPGAPPVGGTTLRSLIQQHTTMPTTAQGVGAVLLRHDLPDRHADAALPEPGRARGVVALLPPCWRRGRRQRRR
jgi:hypothetical protein